MMLALRLENIFVQGSMVHVDYYPANIGFQNTVMHGADLPIVTTIDDAITAYESTAHTEILKFLAAEFPEHFNLEN